MDELDDRRAPLEPARLTPAASLNRLRFVALPGLTLPPDLIGRSAYAVLSAHALAELTQDAEDADVAGGADDQDDQRVALRTAEVARRYGERLGWLLVTLRRGDLASRAARPDWHASYWERWAGLKAVILAGGIVDGLFGAPIAAAATETLTSAGHSDLLVRVAPWPSVLPLIGAARTAPGPFQEATDGVALDFGGSFVKRARARYVDGHLVGLQLLPRVDARWTEPAAGAEPTDEETARLAQFMVTTLADTWTIARARAARLTPAMVVSLASYVRDGQPLARQGGAYAALRTISDDLPGWLGAQVSQVVGQAIRVHLLHDGTAAATALAEESDTAVIVLGTALGAGYPPGYGTRWPASRPLLVEAAGWG